jgi:hypothetical protein
VRTQLDAELAKSARLSTEQSDMTSIVFPPELAARSADPRVAQLLKSESALFAVRRDALTAQLSLITRQVRDTQSEIQARQIQLKAAGRGVHSDHVAQCPAVPAGPGPRLPAALDARTVTILTDAAAISS